MLCRLIGHEGIINSVTWSSKGVVASASSDKKIRLWNVSSDFENVNYKTLVGHTRRVLSVSFSPEGSLLSSQSADMTLRFWDVEKGQPIDFKEYECSAHPNTGGGFDTSTSLLLTLGKKDHSFRVWKVSVEAMLEMYQQRTPEDNREWNRQEVGLIMSDARQPTVIDKILYDSVEGAGFLPVEITSRGFEEYLHRVEESDFLVRAYPTIDELWECVKDIKPFLKEDKKCYLFIEKKVVESTIYPELMNSCAELSSNNCIVDHYSGQNDLYKKVVDILKVRFSNKREGIDTRTEVLKDIKKVDFVIIAATENERVELCKAFNVDFDHRIHKGVNTYWVKRLPTINDKYYYIVISQLSDVTNVNAAVFVANAIHYWHPRAVIMAGIAAAAREEQSLGDIVIGRAVHYHNRGKVTSDGILPEPITYNADPVLFNRAITLSKSSFVVRSNRPDFLDTSPNVYPGVIASGERVIADEEFRNQIAANHRKTKAIEMEGYGISAAAWQQSVSIRCLVIRAISDYGDSEKNDEWQQYAAAAAAGFVKHLLLDAPLEPCNL